MRVDGLGGKRVRLLAAEGDLLGGSESAPAFATASLPSSAGSSTLSAKLSGDESRWVATLLASAGGRWKAGDGPREGGPLSGRLEGGRVMGVEEDRLEGGRLAGAEEGRLERGRLAVGAGDCEEAEASRPISGVLGVGSTAGAALGFAFALLRSHDSALRFARSRTTGFQYEESWPWPWRYSTSGSAGSPTQRRNRRPTLRGRAVGKVGNAARQCRGKKCW